LGERDFNNEEEDVLIFAVLVAWRCISQKVPDIPMVTIEQLEFAEAESEAKLSAWEKAPDDSQITEAMQMLSEQSQPTLFGFLLQTIMESDNVREDTKGLMFLHLKIILDCLLEAAG